ncbi:MAG: hypothetical protein WCP20_18920 [Desulfuromonadales bacterium]
MARTTRKTATILSDLYDETFANDSYEPFRISWPDLRGIAGVSKLTDQYLRQINQALNESGYYLIPFDNFLLVTQESNQSNIRLLPPRIVEQYLYVEADDLEIDEEEDEELSDEEVEDEEDCEVNDEDVNREKSE